MGLEKDIYMFLWWTWEWEDTKVEGEMVMDVTQAKSIIQIADIPS